MWIVYYRPGVGEHWKKRDYKTREKAFRFSREYIKRGSESGKGPYTVRNNTLNGKPFWIYDGNVLLTSNGRECIIKEEVLPKGYTPLKEGI